nr:MAG TPA: hypothetical protein [Caudoviricetes sp.]
MPAPAHPDRLHITGSSAGSAKTRADHARHGALTRRTGLHTIPDRPRLVDRTGAGRWRAGSVSETEQICTHSNMNDFQHKNVCKTIDINTRTCYYIDNTRTCCTTTKTGGQKP